MTEIILLALLILVLYRYVTDTISHVRHTIQITMRMFVVGVAVILILVSLYYSHLKNVIQFIQSIFN